MAQVTLLGKSLGGAVAIYLAAARQNAMQAVIVENTFTSLEDVAPKVSPPHTLSAVRAVSLPLPACVAQELLSCHLFINGRPVDLPKAGAPLLL